MGIELSNTSKVVDVLSSSLISKGNKNGAFIIYEGSCIAVTETKRRDLISGFIYLFELLKEAQSPC